MVASFLLAGFARLVDWLEPARYLSVFHYYNESEPLVDGVDYPYLAVSFVGIAVLLALAFWSFERKDLGV
jgi:hypothetical protein